MGLAKVAAACLALHSERQVGWTLTSSNKVDGGPANGTRPQLALVLPSIALLVLRQRGPQQPSIMLLVLFPMHIRLEAIPILVRC